MVEAQEVQDELRRSTPFRFVSRPVQITFLAVNTKTEVLHGCAEIPDGFQPTRTNGATVVDEPGVQWTKDLAYLRSTIATVVEGVFVKYREDPINVSPT